MTTEADASFDRMIARLRRIQFRLLLIGAPLLVLTPLIVGLFVAAGAGWMKWFWVVSIAIFVAGLALAIWTTDAERRRWRKAVFEIARLDLEAIARVKEEGVQGS